MKRFLPCILAVLAALPLSAQTYVESNSEFQPKTVIRPSQTVLLYPEGQAAGKGIVENGVAVTKGPQEDNGLRGEEICNKKGNRRNIGNDARMDLYFPQRPCGLLVVVAPGGGYGFVSSFNEGAYVAKWLCDNGITACILKYRMPAGHRTVPLDDIQNAMRYCRHHATEWGVDKVGVMGFSAGGHLAATASVLYVDAVTRPDFSVLVYPRLTLTRGERCGTKDQLVGTDASWDGNVAEHLRLLEYWSPENHVGAETPPTFIVLSADDRSVPATNMVPYYSALVRNGVPVELHVYPDGGHGWGFSAEKYVGEGNDKFAAHRPDFEAALLKWLQDRE